MKEKIILLLSVLIGIVALFATNRYLSNQREELLGKLKTVKVVMAGRDLPAGTVLKGEDVAQDSILESVVTDAYIRPEDWDKILGKRLVYPVPYGKPIQWSHIENADRVRRGLSATIKHGMRAVSIAVSGAETVSGLVQPGDHVDILGTFSLPSRTAPGEMETVTLTVLQDVTVLATGSQLARLESAVGGSDNYRAGGYNTVTLEATPRESELLVFIQHMRGLGQLTLSLRHPDDVSFEKDLPEVDFKRLEGALPDLNLYRQRVIRRKTNL